MYLTSSGFDASILHDDDGKKYIVSLEWETREATRSRGVICCVEYDPEPNMWSAIRSVFGVVLLIVAALRLRI